MRQDPCLSISFPNGNLTRSLIRQAPGHLRAHDLPAKDEDREVRRGGRLGPGGPRRGPGAENGRLTEKWVGFGFILIFFCFWLFLDTEVGSTPTSWPASHGGGRLLWLRPPPWPAFLPPPLPAPLFAGALGLLLWVGPRGRRLDYCARTRQRRRKVVVSCHPKSPREREREGEEAERCGHHSRLLSISVRAGGLFI